jgi:AcrR family transcriptional regulator
MGASERLAAGDGRPMRADAQRNYARLLSAAAEAFAEHGADDVSLEEIAKRACVGIGTLYRHFPTRQALLEAVYRDQVEVLSARADELLGSDDPVAGLTAWLQALMTFSSTKRSLTTAMLATMSKESELMTACSKVIKDSAEALVARAQEAGAIRADVTSTDLIRLLHGVSIATERAPTDPGQAGRMIALILDGLRPQPPG